jgi:hypothetical protein
MMALSDYAAVLVRFSRTREAQLLFEEAVAVTRALYPRNDDPLVATALNNLALLLQQQVRLAVCVCTRSCSTIALTHRNVLPAAMARGPPL